MGERRGQVLPHPPFSTYPFPFPDCPGVQALAMTPSGSNAAEHSHRQGGINPRYRAPAGLGMMETRKALPLWAGGSVAAGCSATTLDLQVLRVWHFLLMAAQKRDSGENRPGNN